jgi:hypothetical protein
VTVKNDTTVTAPVNTSSTTTLKVTAALTPSVTNNISSPIITKSYRGPDLAVRVMQVGILNGRNLVTTQNRFNYSDMVGIKFEVRNDGDANTGPWNFTTFLPSLTTPIYNSDAQISLRPGDSILFTIGFSNLTNQDIGLVTINIDPQNLVKESTEANNIVTSTIYNLSFNSNYYNNNTFGVGCYVNGFFTYNCTGNSNNYTYGNNNLGVTCYGEPDNANTGERVHWYATAVGGNGNYSYDWSGTNSLNSSSQNPSKTYSSSGTKKATVTVTANGYSVSHTCSVYVD